MGQDDVTSGDTILRSINVLSCGERSGELCSVWFYFQVSVLNVSVLGIGRIYLNVFHGSCICIRITFDRVVHLKDF